MTESTDILMLMDKIREVEVKRRLLNDEIEKLPPELKVELQARKPRLIQAMTVIWELPTESQPLYEKIERISDKIYVPLWCALAVIVLTSILSKILLFLVPFLPYSFIVAIITALPYIEMHFQLIELKSRFSLLSDKIEDAKQTLYLYGNGEIDSFGSWHRRRLDIVGEDEHVENKMLLVEANFLIDLEASILVNLGKLHPHYLVLKSNGLM